MQAGSTTKSVIIIVGPTAVGKTAVAITVARHFHTCIISADSRQCFKELSIGVARPSERELQEVPHYFIASHSIHDEVTAASFEEYALEKTTALFRNHDVVVITGGTGLYIKAFTEGLDAIPPVPDSVRKEIARQYEQRGLPWLQQQVKEKDPLFFQQGEIANPQRMMRALEVVDTTGQSILSFRKGEKKKRDFHIIKIGLELPREELNQRINLRVDQMVRQGLEAEARSVWPLKQLNALQTVGYQELFDYFDGKLSLAQAIDQIKTSTRQYGKRQYTWFRKDKDIAWFHPSAIKDILTYVEDRLRSKVVGMQP